MAELERRQRAREDWPKDLVLVGLDCAGQARERTPLQTCVGWVAIAGFEVQVLATARAKSFAVFFAERAARQGEQHLFAHDILKGKTAHFIIADFGLVEGNGTFAGVSVSGLRAEDEVEAAGERRTHRLHAAGAEEFEVAVVGGADADVGDLLAVAAVFNDEIGTAGDGERANLGDVGSVFEGAGRDGLVEEEGFVFELERGDDHALRVGRCRLQVNGRNGAGSLHGFHSRRPEPREARRAPC
jgi:hypothetical protein